MIQKHFDDILDQKYLKTPSKRKKLVKKLLTFSTGLESSNNQMSKNQRKRKKERKSSQKQLLLQS